MTKIDIKDMEDWQTSPEGLVQRHVYDLENVIKLLCQSDPNLIRQYRDDLITSSLDLAVLLGATIIDERE